MRRRVSRSSLEHSMSTPSPSPSTSSAPISVPDVRICSSRDAPADHNLARQPVLVGRAPHLAPFLPCCGLFGQNQQHVLTASQVQIRLAASQREKSWKQSTSLRYLIGIFAGG